MFLCWIVLLLCVVTGELIQGTSGPMVLLSKAKLNDKFVHFIAYAGIAFIPAFGFRLGTAMQFLIITELTGIGLEFAQTLVPDRSCDPVDAAANTAGVVIGAVLGSVMRSHISFGRQQVNTLKAGEGCKPSHESSDGFPNSAAPSSRPGGADQ